MGIDVLGLVTAGAGVATTWINLLHGRDDGSMVKDMVKAMNEEGLATQAVTDHLAQAFKETQGQLTRLIDAMVQRGGSPES